MENLLNLSGVDYLFDTRKRIYWLYLVSSLLIAWLFVRYKQLSFRRIFSPLIWFHPSAKLDYSYFLIISFIKLTFVLPLVISAGEVALEVLGLLNEAFGYIAPVNLNRSTIVFLYTLTLFIASDFTRYWLHRLMHSSKILWQFHKVHHSAEVLNPITFYRIHPVENFLFGLRYALTAGIVTGIFLYLFAARVQMADILGVNFIIFISMILGANLRHSPVLLGYPDYLEKWFISPAQHQYHHSLSGVRKNYGGILSIWDRLFNTLTVSKPQQDQQCGLESTEIHHYRTLTGLLFSPFKLIWLLQRNKHDKYKTEK